MPEMRYRVEVQSNTRHIAHDCRRCTSPETLVALFVDDLLCNSDQPLRSGLVYSVDSLCICAVKGMLATVVELLQARLEQIKRLQKHA